MTTGNSECDQRRVIEEAIPRIYAKPDVAARRILEELVLGPKSANKIASILKSKGYKSGIEGVAKELSVARKFIGAFYHGPRGFSDPWRLEVPRSKSGGRYTVTAVENKPLEDAGGFWAGHLGNDKPTKIITGRPEFIQGERIGLLLRFEMFNGQSSSLIEHLQKDSDPDLHGEEMTSVKPYIAISDVRAMLSIYSYLDSWRRRYSHHAPELLGSEEDAVSEEANIVSLGTPFDNRRINELENEAHKLECFGRGSLYLNEDGGLQKTMPNGDYRVWVHRRWVGSRCETLVNASSSVVLAPICSTLTSDKEMTAIIRELASGRPWPGFPREFKIQFRVRMAADGQKAKRIWVQQYVGKDDHPVRRPEIRRGFIVNNRCVEAPPVP